MQRKAFLLGLGKIGAAAGVLLGGMPATSAGFDEPASKPRPMNSVNDVTIPPSLKIGQMMDFGPDEVPYSRETGVLYGGIYKYVRFRSGMKALPGHGMLAFWDTSVDENQYQVTCDESIGSSPTAGVVLNNVNPGNYGWIQIAGKATVKTRSKLTQPGASGQVCLAAYAGPGPDVATVDNVGPGGLTPNATDVARAMRAFLGVYEGSPANGSLEIVQLRFWFQRV
jgi:hypothetical protein